MCLVLAMRAGKSFSSVVLSSPTRSLVLILVGGALAKEQCIAADTINGFFETDSPTCCQFDIYGIPCPEPVPAPSKGKLNLRHLLVLCGVASILPFSKSNTPLAPHCFAHLVGIGYGIALIITIVISFLIGRATLPLVQGNADNFFT